MSRSDFDAGQVLDALGNPVRREILLFLRDSPLAVGEIAGRLPISRPAVSKHLRILEAAGLVSYREAGASNVFFIKGTGFRELRQFLDLFWDEALANFKALAETIDLNEIDPQ